MKSGLTAAASLAFLSACTSPQDAAPTPSAQEASAREETLWVNAQLKPCMGVAPRQCLEVRRSPDGPWELFYANIEGFDFVPGQRYELRVRVERLKNVPADASSLRYSLIEARKLAQ